MNCMERMLVLLSLIGGTGCVKFDADGRKEDKGSLVLKLHDETCCSLSDDEINRWEIHEGELVMTFGAIEFDEFEYLLRAEDEPRVKLSAEQILSYEVKSITPSRLVEMFMNLPIAERLNDFS